MEEHSQSIVDTQLRSVSRLHANTSSSDIYLRKQPNQQAHLELCHRNPDILERVLNQILLANSTAGNQAVVQVIKQREHESVNNRETKMILLSDEPQLIAHNFKGFANVSKSMMRKLGLSGFELMYCDLGNAMHFSFLTIQFFPPTQKITIPKKVSVL